VSAPAADLQVAIFGALNAASAVTAFVGTRIYDHVDPNALPTFPYLTIPDDQVIDDGNTCGDASEVFVDIHIWDRGAGAIRSKRVAEAVRDALSAEIAVAGHTTTVGAFEAARNVNDPDGITKHRVVTFRYLLQPDE
jgi:hypothetical protein